MKKEHSSEVSAVCRVGGVSGCMQEAAQQAGRGGGRVPACAGLPAIAQHTLLNLHQPSQPHARTWLQGFSCSVLLAASSARPGEAEGAHWLGQRDLEVGAGGGGWGAVGLVTWFT